MLLNSVNHFLLVETSFISEQKFACLEETKLFLPSGVSMKLSVTQMIVLGPVFLEIIVY